MVAPAGWILDRAYQCPIYNVTGPSGQTAVVFGNLATATDTVVLIHGMASSKERFLSFALQCVDAGKAVIACDLPFHGERRVEPFASIMLYPPHPHFMKVCANVCKQLLDELPELLTALQVTQPVTVLGHSLGGRIAYHMALRRLDVRRVICVGAPIGVEAIPKGSTFTEKDHAYWNPIDPFAGTGALLPVPITFIHGAADKVCPLFTIERLQQLVKETAPTVPFEILVVPDTGHEFTGPIRAAAFTVVTSESRTSH